MQYEKRKPENNRSERARERERGGEEEEEEEEDVGSVLCIGCRRMSCFSNWSREERRDLSSAAPSPLRPTDSEWHRADEHERRARENGAHHTGVLVVKHACFMNGDARGERVSPSCMSHDITATSSRTIGVQSG